MPQQTRMMTRILNGPVMPWIMARDAMEWALKEQIYKTVRSTKRKAEGFPYTYLVMALRDRRKGPSTNAVQEAVERVMLGYTPDLDIKDSIRSFVNRKDIQQVRVANVVHEHCNYMADVLYVNAECLAFRWGEVYRMVSGDMLDNSLDTTTQDVLEQVQKVLK